VTRVAEDVPHVRDDRRAVKQILVTLLTNAIKFTPSGGRISLEVRLGARGAAELSVADTGIGIAEEDIPTALADFGQVDSGMARKYDGTGLGLPLVKRYAALHGAAVRIDSALPGGTTVVVSFPPERVAKVSGAATSGEIVRAASVTDPAEALA
jgi:signal transduction histidine kinase